MWVNRIWNRVCSRGGGGGVTYPWCLFCQRSRGEIDAAGWFTSWNPLLPLKSLKSSFLRGEPLFNTPLPVHYLLLYMCVKRKQESGLSSLLFLFLTPPSCLRIGQILWCGARGIKGICFRGYLPEQKGWKRQRKRWMKSRVGVVGRKRCKRRKQPKVIQKLFVRLPSPPLNKGKSSWQHTSWM